MATLSQVLNMKLHKHMATLSEVLNMKKNEMDQLARKPVEKIKNIRPDFRTMWPWKFEKRQKHVLVRLKISKSERLYNGVMVKVSSTKGQKESR